MPSEVREQLMEERRITHARMLALEHEVSDIIESAKAGATDDEHDPEGATIGFERAQAIALLDETRVQLDDLDLALARVGAGTYGRCETCGQDIAIERLVARPSATACITCASRRR